jgi:predicted glycosyltransferase
LAAPARPTLLFYCQHSLGIGHLTRSFALAAALTRSFRVVFLNGGRLPAGVPVPTGVERIDLPPLGMDDGHTVVSRDGAHDVASAQAERQRLIMQALQNTRPAVLLVELFPFGRKKFAGEILPLLRAARRLPGGPAKVVCSLRDILVDARPDQQHHDDRARWLTDRYFDAVLVHADPVFARLEDSFHPSRPMRTPVHYTGFVVPARPALAAPVRRAAHVLVSAGGGIVGDSLFSAVLAARRLLGSTLPLRIVAGPFLPEAHWQALLQRTEGLAGVEVLRHVPDMVAELRQARASISQCGYNTALDLVVAEVPALVVPYQTATENEQQQRAQRLAAAGALLHLPAAEAEDPAALAAALQQLLGFQPRPAAMALDGAVRSAEILARLVAPAAARHPRREMPACLTH